MKVEQFVKEIAERFDTKLKKQSEIDAFMKDCRSFLKFYEGQVLEWTLNEIIATQKTRTHPNVATIKTIASKIAGDEERKKQTYSDDSMKMAQSNAKKNEFMKTDLFKQCCMDMVGNCALLFVERNLEYPTQGDINDMKQSHRKLVENLRMYKADPDLSDVKLTVYKLGLGTYLKNLNLKRVLEGKHEWTEQDLNKAA